MWPRQQMLVITVLLMVILMLRNIVTQKCGFDSYSIYQKMLQGHTFKTFKVRPNSFDCRHACNSDIRCQSYNYVIFKDICELNNRTKEARPEDFVKDKDRYYMAKAPKRGTENLMSKQSISELTVVISDSFYNLCFYCKCSPILPPLYSLFYFRLALRIGSNESYMRMLHVDQSETISYCVIYSPFQRWRLLFICFACTSESLTQKSFNCLKNISANDLGYDKIKLKQFEKNNKSGHTNKLFFFFSH